MHVQVFCSRLRRCTTTSVPPGTQSMPGEEALARIALEFQPAHLAAGGGDDADRADESALLAFGYPHRHGKGVERVGGVDEQEVVHLVGIELPEGDAAAIGAPAPAVAQAEFLLVDPVEGAVDDGARAVAGEPDHDAGGEVLDVQVVLAHVAHAAAVGRELGEEQRGGLAPARRPGARSAFVDAVAAPSSRRGCSGARRGGSSR